MENGEYIFYADESGDHSLVSVDPNYPVFVLSICSFKVRDYCRKVVPDFQQFKFRYFRHDMVILQEREIRKQTGDFAILLDMALREKFMSGLSDMISAAPFRIYSVIIDKHEFRSDFFPDNPYVVALRYSLEEIYRSLKLKGLENKRYYFVFEKRGVKEDHDLELEFRRITDGQNVFQIAFPGFHIRFADKLSNSTGMQLADLTARPIGLHYLRPTQDNRAFDVVREKVHKFKIHDDFRTASYLQNRSLKSEKPRINRGKTPTGNPQSISLNIDVS